MKKGKKGKEGKRGGGLYNKVDKEVACYISRHIRSH